MMMMMMTAAMNVWVKFYHAWSLGDSAIQCSERSLGRVTLANKVLACIAVFSISIWVIELSTSLREVHSVQRRPLLWPTTIQLSQSY